MKNKILGSATLAFLIVLTSSPVSAGVYADDATRCLVKSTTDADQLALVKWIFSAIALHPSLKDYSNITTDQRKQIDTQMSVLVRKLLTEACRKETVDAIKYEGTGFLEKSFGALGQIAVGGLMTNPDVSKGLGAWATPADIQIFQSLAAEAGRPAPVNKPVPAAQ